MKVRVADLKVGDKVQLFEGPYGTGTVVSIVEASHSFLTVERPYVIYNEDIRASMIGIERITFTADDTREIERY